MTFPVRRAGRLSTALVLGSVTATSWAAPAQPFLGWESFRVVGQDGEPQVIRALDLDADGRDEILVVNTRQARLDIYHWVPVGERKAPPAADPERPNELAMAPELRRDELPVNELPRDVEAIDIDNDGKKELVLLGSPPHTVTIFDAVAGDQNQPTKWKARLKWDLLPGQLAGRGRLIIARRSEQGPPELLISFDEGIQTLSLVKGSRPAWLSPRDKGGRVDWWQADLDGDGDTDVVEFTRNPKQTLRWYEAGPFGLLPAQTLFADPVADVELLPRAGAPAEVLMLSGQQEGLLRRYGLSRGEPLAVGSRQVLPIPGEGTVWTGVDLAGRKAVVVADPAQPSLMVHTLGERGWSPAMSFPSVAKVRAIAPAGPGKLLIWATDASDLLVSEWKEGRLSYPTPWPQSAQVEKRRIVALGATADAVWWAQAVDVHVDLYTLAAGQAEPKLQRFEQVGANVDRVNWIGGQRLLVLEKFARSPKLVTLEAGKAKLSEPGHLKSANLDEFRILGAGPDAALARLTDGVIQWMSPDLHATDQVMLPEAAKIAGYVPINKKQAWALQIGGELVHWMEADASGILRVAATHKLPGGQTLVRDGVLGLVLASAQSLAVLAPGQPWEMKVEQSIDSREGRPSGAREATIQRVMVEDVDGDGVADALLCDDRRHQLTLLTRQPDGSFKALLSWPVFENKAYPYGGPGGDGRSESEPRGVAGLDFDGDGRRDLALLCHDRLLIYLARKNP